MVRYRNGDLCDGSTAKKEFVLTLYCSDGDTKMMADPDYYGGECTYRVVGYGPAGCPRSTSIIVLGGWLLIMM